MGPTMQQKHGAHLARRDGIERPAALRELANVPRVKAFVSILAAEDEQLAFADARDAVAPARQ